MKNVVPHAGTWIEIRVELVLTMTDFVVPHAGTWIEIIEINANVTQPVSFPTRERGLKLQRNPEME